MQLRTLPTTSPRRLPAAVLAPSRRGTLALLQRRQQGLAGAGPQA
ncbi:hypothetical protein [Melaminivora jejuensis]|nr:hypothetical protein [Melaminivora jejuensis]